MMDFHSQSAFGIETNVAFRQMPLIYLNILTMATISSEFNLKSMEI